jgi:hypothetical protein
VFLFGTFFGRRGSFSPTTSTNSNAGSRSGSGRLFIGLTRTDPLFFHDLRFFPPRHDLRLDFRFVAFALAD